MTVVPGSRYANNPLLTVQVRGQVQQVIGSPVQAPNLITYKWYQLTESDTAQTLATTNYSDPTKWWQIADANPEIMDWSDVTPGVMIRIPIFS